jgi:hypothetical protein
MKKFFVMGSLLAIVFSCSGPPAGGNKNIIKLQPEVERYSDDAQDGKLLEDYKANHATNAAPAAKAEAPKVADSVKVEAAAPAHE